MADSQGNNSKLPHGLHTLKGTVHNQSAQINNPLCAHAKHGADCAEQQTMLKNENNPQSISGQWTLSQLLKKTPSQRLGSRST